MVKFEKQLKILVMGCSSAGKSTFIASTLVPVLLENRYVRNREDIDILFAGQLKLNYKLGKKKCIIIHYNSLLDFDSNPQNDDLNIENEYVFSKILTDDFDEIFYCYTPDAILLDRVRKRALIETELLSDNKRKFQLIRSSRLRNLGIILFKMITNLKRKFLNVYPRDHILHSFSKISQRKILLDTHSLLKTNRDNFSVVFSQKKTSMVIPFYDFVEAPRSVFLQKVLSDEKCNIELIQHEFHRYSPLAAKCAEFLSRDIKSTHYKIRKFVSNRIFNLIKNIP